MELFEEALQKWEQALNIRHQTLSTSSDNSLALEGAACADPPVVMKSLCFCTCRVFVSLLFVVHCIFDTVYLVVLASGSCIKSKHAGAHLFPLPWDLG